MTKSNFSESACLHRLRRRYVGIIIVDIIFVVVMAPRGVAWRIPELRHLVQLVGEHMPATEQQWEEVQELHEGAFPHNRSITALSNKFKDLYRMKMPTGDPKIPDYVQ